MNILLPLTETAIKDCQDHINQHPDIDPVISVYLARYINGLMCMEIEQVVTRLIRDRLAIGCSDTATSNFLKSMGRSSVRNAKISEIRDTIRLFGNDYGNTFNTLVDQSVGQEGIEKLGMAVRKRNENAHENPPNITFRDLQEAFSIAVKVVEAVKLTLEPQA